MDKRIITPIANNLSSTDLVAEINLVVRRNQATEVIIEYLVTKNDSRYMESMIGRKRGIISQKNTRIVRSFSLDHFFFRMQKRIDKVKIVVM